jgi:hypothetical protein
MTRTFDVHLPEEQGWLRSVRLAAEILDGVTLSRVTDGIKVTAKGLLSSPIINSDGSFVFLTEPNREPLSVSVDPGWLPFEPQSANVPPLPASPLPTDRRLIIELSPRRAYPFPSGVTGIRARLIQQRASSPQVPAAAPAVPVWLQWIDDTAAGTEWVDAPVRGVTDLSGDFAAILRFTPAQVPRLDAQGQVRARVRATQAGITWNSIEFQIPLGRITDVANEFAWNEFQP